MFCDMEQESHILGVRISPPSCGCKVWKSKKSWFLFIGRPFVACQSDNKAEWEASSHGLCTRVFHKTEIILLSDVIYWNIRPHVVYVHPTGQEKHQYVELFTYFGEPTSATRPHYLQKYLIFYSNCSYEIKILKKIVESNSQ